MVEEAIDGTIEPVVPEPVLAELERVAADKLRFDAVHVRRARELFESLAVAQPAAPDAVAEVTGDRSDDAILACALDANADVLVTGDRRHLLPLGTYRSLRIVTPQALLAELRSG